MTPVARGQISDLKAVVTYFTCGTSALAPVTHPMTHVHLPVFSRLLIAGVTEWIEYCRSTSTLRTPHAAP